MGSVYGVTFTIKDAQAIPIRPLRDGFENLDEAHTRCKNFQFGYQEFETINGQSSVAFLKKMEGMYPDARTLHLIWDRAGYHTAQEVAEFLKTSRIKVHYLPPRSPNLNPIERLWKIMHEYVSYNRVYDKFGLFKESLFHFFDHTMTTIKDTLISRITDNFQIINPT